LLRAAANGAARPCFRRAARPGIRVELTARAADSLLNRDPIDRNNGSFLTTVDFFGSGSGKDKYNGAWMIVSGQFDGSQRLTLCGKAGDQVG